MQEIRKGRVLIIAASIIVVVFAVYILSTPPSRAKIESNYNTEDKTLNLKNVGSIDIKNLSVTYTTIDSDRFPKVQPETKIIGDLLIDQEKTVSINDFFWVPEGYDDVSLHGIIFSSNEGTSTVEFTELDFGKLIVEFVIEF